MSADPAELIFFRNITPDKFFGEADRLGIPHDDLQDPQIRERVFHACLITHRAETAKAVAAELRIAIREDQAQAIARNSLVPEVLSEPAPLSPEERIIAAEMYYHALVAAAARYGTPVAEKKARRGAQKMIRAGERGLTALQKLTRTTGCLVMLAVVGLGGGLGVFSVALILAAVKAPG